MSDFTYETNNRKEVLETYEWDNVWIDHANDQASNRVLYIGDSISCGTRRVATALTNETILFDGFGTSKAVDNPYLQDAIRLFIKQLPRLDVILFNNGLHGFHLEDETEYAYYYEETVKFLLAEYPKTPLFLALSTFVASKNDVERVKARNRAVLAIAEKYKLPVVDLYTVTEANRELLSGDGVHFTPEGYEVIAKEIIQALKK